MISASSGAAAASGSGRTAASTIASALTVSAARRTAASGTHDLHNWPGETLYDREGSKIGEIVEIYADRGTGEPAWLAVKTGLFGSNISFVPLREAARSEDGIRVPYDKEPIVEKRVVPKERVRLDKETITGERAVSEEVRKEQIEAEEGR